MAKVPVMVDPAKSGKCVLNVESVGLTEGQFFGLCGEYVANGAILGFLIYPAQRQVYVYRPGQVPQCLSQPVRVPADPELPGFTLDLAEIRQ